MFYFISVRPNTEYSAEYSAKTSRIFGTEYSAKSADTPITEYSAKMTTFDNFESYFCPSWTHIFFFLFHFALKYIKIDSYASKLVTTLKKYLSSFTEKKLTKIFQIFALNFESIIGRIFGRIFGCIWPNIRYRPIPLLTVSVVH